MTKVIKCNSMATSEDLMRLMTDYKIRHIPIVREISNWNCFYRRCCKKVARK